LENSDLGIEYNRSNPFFDAAFSSSPPFENVVEVTVLLVFND